MLDKEIAGGSSGGRCIALHNFIYEIIMRIGMIAIVAIAVIVVVWIRMVIIVSIVINVVAIVVLRAAYELRWFELFEYSSLRAVAVAHRLVRNGVSRVPESIDAH